MIELVDGARPMGEQPVPLGIFCGQQRRLYIP